ncbi:hypothetical protein NKR19_g8112 [Coniochaeta hoffmannii]|uniref:Uncharacterized protein n=1 Tax=Coniochaeta hoffmannii TaxID=91930 RepID=A0AA38R5D5_9PEZI|nr:hypothetical protein NKR19_g8112 [Coniochaeta hoffmannii]
MADYMNPSRLKPQTYNAYIFYPGEFDPVKAQDHQLGMDLNLMRKMLLTSHSQDPVSPGKPQLHMTKFEFSRNKRVLRSLDKPVAGPLNAPPTIGDEVLDLVQRHYFEADGALARLWLERQKPPRVPTGPRSGRNGRQNLRVDAVEHFDRYIREQQRRERKTWRDEDVRHLHGLNLQLAMAQRQSPRLESLYDGGAHLALVHRMLDVNAQGERPSRPSLRNYHFAIADRITRPSCVSSRFWPQAPSLDFFIQPRWCDRRHFKMFCDMAPALGPDRRTGRGRPKTRFPRRAGFDEETSKRRSEHQRRFRGKSEPPHGSFCTARFPDPGDESLLPGRTMVIFPRLPLSVLDRRTRRRSLSRSHVADMFDWDCEDLSASASALTSSVENHKQVREKEKPASSNPFPPCPPCANCASRGHPLSDCLQPCGHCGAPNPKTLESDFPTKFTHPRPDGIPHLRGAALSAHEVFIASSRETTLILSGHDTILVSRGAVDWLRSGDAGGGGSTRDTVVLGPGIAGVPGVWPVGDWSYPIDDRCQHPVAVPGPGKHANPHTADKCPVPRTGRCRCVAFPQYHVAAACRESVLYVWREGSPREGV